MKTKEEIATKATNLADVLTGDSLVERTMRELALMIVDLANALPSPKHPEWEPPGGLVRPPRYPSRKK